MTITAVPIEAQPLNERQARVAWACIIEPGDQQATTLIESEGGAAAALTALIEEQKEIQESPYLQGALDRWLPRLSMLNVSRAISQLARFDIHTIIPGDDEWPTAKFARLGSSAPVVLFGRGDISLLLDEKSIGVVGARAATGYGEHITMEISAGLVERGITVISGAAFGIDGMAHRAVLASKGRTIAVLAGGLDRFYPSAHDALLARIVETGLVLSEVVPGTSPTKWRFLQRNRIIAALSDAVVVVEAGWRSGSLNTAGHAKDAGVPVGAVPGPVTSSASAGCHRLIQERDARLVTNADEVVALIRGAVV